jgi:hypothetical protein
MKTGAIYVNGWASRENPHAAGVAIGRGELLFPDGLRGRITVTKFWAPTYGRVLRRSPLVQAAETWRFEDLRAACRRAVEEHHEEAAAYALEILWPMEYDAEAQSMVTRGEYIPPTFEEWKATQAQKTSKKVARGA